MVEMQKAKEYEDGKVQLYIEHLLDNIIEGRFFGSLYLQEISIEKPEHEKPKLIFRKIWKGTTLSLPLEKIENAEN